MRLTIRSSTSPCRSARTDRSTATDMARGGRIFSAPAVGSLVWGLRGDGGGDARRDQRERPALHPRALARCEARRQEPVVDLARHGEAIELRRGEEETVVREPA